MKYYIAIFVISLSSMSSQSIGDDHPKPDTPQGAPMSGPARAGLFVYAKDLQQLSDFYQTVLGMAQAHSTPDLVVLRSPDFHITVSAIPEQIAEQIEIATPPVRRDNSAYKFFFTVDSLSEAGKTASSLGGRVLPELYRGPGFVVQNVVDPEGNIFQLRENTP